MQNTSSAKEVARQLSEWVNSDVGRRELQDVLEKADQSTAKLDNERRLDPVTLQEHFTL